MDIFLEDYMEAFYDVTFPVFWKYIKGKKRPPALSVYGRFKLVMVRLVSKKMKKNESPKNILPA